MRPRTWFVAVLLFAGTWLTDKSSSAQEAGAFDRVAASQAMETVDIASCKRASKQGLDGHVTITFEPTGIASAIVVDRGPPASTRMGRCVAAKYKRVRVPAFSGPSIRVGKNFHVD